MRIHVPIVTDRNCKFSSWLLDGREVTHHMPAGTAWYLDTRKPHAARNFGTSERVHLVMDTVANDELRALL